MSSFDARLRLPGHSRLPLGVEVDVASDCVTVSSGNRTVATWPRTNLEVESQADGFHITVDGEKVILNVTESARFAAALGVTRFAKRLASIGEHRSEGAPVAAAQSQPVTAAQGDGAPKPSVPAVTTAPDPVDDYAGRIDEVVAALKSDSMSAVQAFGKWLRLLKELNLRHGQGSMTTDQFFQLNTEVLGLISEPKPASDIDKT